MRKETLLHQHRYRKSRRFLERTLAEEFREITADGRSIDKRDVLNRLPTEQPGDLTLVALDMTAWEVADGIVHIVYDLEKTVPGLIEPQRSKRTSLWRRERDTWVMLFHQGTIILSEVRSSPG